MYFIVSFDALKIGMGVFLIAILLKYTLCK